MRDTVRNRSIKLSRSSPYRSLTVIVGLIVVAISLMWLDQGDHLDPVRHQAQMIVNPMLGGLRYVGTSISDGFWSIGNMGELQETIKDQEEYISYLETELIKSEEANERISQLEQQLAITEAQPWELLGASVIAYTPDAGRQILRLDAGEEDGVSRGMAVISKSGGSPETLIGVVENVTSRDSTVLLITDYSSSISASVAHEGTRFYGTVQGQWQRGSRLQLEQIERNAHIVSGNRVVTAALTAEYAPDLPHASIPSNIAIGEIEEVRVDGRSRVAEIRPYLDPNQVRYAWIILSHDD
ncbi:MAG: rod shape-determining protein MreC [Chloroflexota bacterium]